MTKQSIYIVLITLILFLGTNVLGLLGINQNTFQALIIAISVILALKNRKYFSWDKRFLILLAISCIYGLYKLKTDTGEGTRAAVLTIIGAPLCFAAYPKLYGKTLYDKNEKVIFLWRKIAKIAFVFFIVETGMAVIERIIGTDIIGWRTSDQTLIMDDGYSGFRSTSLWGHPLYNALIVSTFMFFIITSSLKQKYKFGLYLLGYFAILGFNTRGSMVGTALMLGVYVFHYVVFAKNVSLKRRMQLLGGTIIVFIVGVFLLFRMNYGGRLLEMGLFDDSSAQTRIDVFSIFQNFDMSYFLFGLPLQDIDFVKSYSGIKVTENFWIDWLLKFGIVFLLAYTICIISFVRRLYNGYPIFTRFFTGCGFILIASTNNSLSSNYSALLIYFLLIVVFNPVYFNRIVPRKYLS